jgi:hypothetical protein
MARTTESAMQRLQVGLLGLLVVLLFVSLASMLSGGTDEKSKTSASAGGIPAGASDETKKTPDEPPVELGVTPVVPEQPDKLPARQPAPTP